MINCLAHGSENNEQTERFSIWPEIHRTPEAAPESI